MQFVDMSQYQEKFQQAEKIGKAEAELLGEIDNMPTLPGVLEAVKSLIGIDDTNEDDTPSTDIVDFLADLSAAERTRRLDAVERDAAQQREFIRRADEGNRI